jgi:membrane protein DedA with SNARE-associated domain
MIDIVSAVFAAASPSPSPSPLPGVFGSLQPTLHHYGYLAVGAILVLENIGFPVPGETILIAAALYAAAGQLNIVLVALIAIVASTVGSTIGYVIGMYGGRPLAERYGRYVFLTPERLSKTEDFFNRRGWLVVLLGRFVEGVRQAVGIIAGITEMTFPVFVLFTVLGSMLWVVTWSVVGEIAGAHVTTISRYATYVAVAVAVGVVLLVGRAILRARRNRRSPGVAG